MQIYSKVGKYNVTLAVDNAKGNDTKTIFEYTIKNKWTTYWKIIK